MTPEQFCYWLQGRAELVAGPPDEAQWACILEHLRLVFRKETPPGPGDLQFPYFPPPEYPAPFLNPLPYRPQIIC